MNEMLFIYDVHREGEKGGDVAIALKQQLGFYYTASKSSILKLICSSIMETLQGHPTFIKAGLIKVCSLSFQFYYTLESRCNNLPYKYVFQLPLSETTGSTKYDSQQTNNRFSLAGISFYFRHWFPLGAAMISTKISLNKTKKVLQDRISVAISINEIYLSKHVSSGLISTPKVAQISQQEIGFQQQKQSFNLKNQLPVDSVTFSTQRKVFMNKRKRFQQGGEQFSTSRNRWKMKKRYFPQDRKMFSTGRM